ncbi:MAG: Sec-independent protein translocase protein TatB [Bdellovibrionaceae bacterium]|jgi:sec-independent protein translocase protein TatB|nr:Sec-independent protein translocase protein TatB [Pseudobdellovibrionaceae bacterium]
MFGIGFWELVAIGVIALIFVGPQDLPKLARNLGRLLNELKRGSDQFVNEIKESAAWEETGRELKKTQQQLSHVSARVTEEVLNLSPHESAKTGSASEAQADSKLHVAKKDETT